MKRSFSQSMTCVALLLLSALLAACSDKVTEVTKVNEIVGVFKVEPGESMPECTLENDGNVIYVEDSSKVFYCANREWSVFDGKSGAVGPAGEKGNVGAKGETGDEGAKGETGNPGKKGADGNPGAPGAAGDSCSVEPLPDETGYKVVCGGDSVGVLLHGKNAVFSSFEENPLSSEARSSCSGAESSSSDVELSSSVAESSSSEVVFSSGDASIYDAEKNTLMDLRDGQVYRTVRIAPALTEYSEVWMGENLNYRYHLITDGGSVSDSSSYCYGNELDSCAKYGRLYLWSAAVDSAALFSTDGKGRGDTGVEKQLGKMVRGVCPNGWRLPSKGDYQALFDAIGGPAGNYLKSETGWKRGYQNVDAYYFTALPGGYRNSKGEYSSVLESASFWTYENEQLNPPVFRFFYDSNIEWPRNYSASNAFSVRCIKN